MIKCNNCEWYEFKNKKHRPFTCYMCELNYNWNEFKQEFFDHTQILLNWSNKILYVVVKIIRNTIYRRK